MPTDRYALLSEDEKLSPTHPAPHVPIEIQAERMRELRKIANEIPSAHLRRDRELQRLANSGSLSRQDMAIAVGLAKSRVDQIIRGLTLADQAKKSRELIARLRLHMPEDMVNEVIADHPELAEAAEEHPYADDMGEATRY